jgi:pilus assembly protein Flp/PilA
VKKFLKLLKDVSGASAAEYALILAIVGAAIAVASVTLGEAIGGAMGDASDCITGTDTTCRADAGGGGGSGS